VAIQSSRCVQDAEQCHRVARELDRARIGQVLALTGEHFEMSRAANTPKPRNIAVTIVVNRISHLGKRAALKSLFKSAQVKSS
jgi:hypothetical protein